MKKYEWLNIDCILKAINTHLVDDGFMLIKPVLSGEGSCDPGMFWLVDMAGDVVVNDFDLAEFSGGYNLLKTKYDRGSDRDNDWDFELFVANTRDGLLLKVNPDYFTDKDDAEFQDGGI